MIRFLSAVARPPRNRGAGPPRRRFPAAAAVPLLLAGAAVWAAQWVVDDDGPADFISIQSAIEAVYVHAGDSILVKPGYYAGNVLLDTKDLTIRSEGGARVTILDAQGSGSVVSLVDRTSATRVEGFTITGGRDQTGGGVFIFGGGPVVTRNIIEGNQAVGGMLGYGYGGAIEVYSSAAVITRNVIRANSALDGGGGIDVYFAGPSTAGTCCPTISQNTIVGNVVTAPAGAGGGIFVYASEPLITSSVVSANSASAGGGIFVHKAQGNADLPEARSNIFYANAPDDADANGAWTLPRSNRQVDPRLGPEDGTDLHPRSDSPALDAAEPGLAPGLDVMGTASPVDSDLDGATAGDVGAIESRGEITSLEAAPDPAAPGAVLLTWDGALNPAVQFRVYASDADPFRNDGGFCLASSLAMPRYSDPAALPPGAIRFYLVTGKDVVEGSRGVRSDGTPRPSAPTCAP